MTWIYFIVWCLCSSVCEGSWLTASQPVIHGQVQSPQYPRPYPPNLMRQWELWVPEGFQIQLSLTHLDIKSSDGCYQDSLTVLFNQTVLGKFCGWEGSSDHLSEKLILSPGNRLTLIFQTSDSTSERQQHVGFSGAYEAVDIDECLNPGRVSGPSCSQLCVNTPGSYHCSCYDGYELHADQRTCVLSCSKCMFDKPEGRVSSPGYPHPSPPFLSCKYIISVEPGFTVTLNFTDNFHIDTPRGPSCSRHWLQVTVPGREPTKLCGAKRPDVISTDSNIVRLDYHTDQHGLSSGWSLDYSTRRVQCSHPRDVVNGRVTPILTEYFYRDHVHVTCDPGYRLMTNCQNLKTFSAMCQINGQWDHPMPECHSTLIDCGEPEPLLNGGVTRLSGFQNQHCSVIQYHCNEPFYSLSGDVNVTFTCEPNGKWKSSHNSAVTPTCVPVCGKPTKSSGFERIPGDTGVPCEVQLYSDGESARGMVIADRWILTSAHAVSPDGTTVSNESLKIVFGVNIRPHEDSLKHAASIHVHPEYNNVNHINDIALIKLKDSITFSSSIMPICLPAEGAAYDTGRMGRVLGFENLYGGGRNIRIAKLEYLSMPLANQETCNNSLTLLKETMEEEEDDIPSLTTDMFCAGFPEDRDRSCTKESGGPFALTDGGRFWAAGIVSWGVDCFGVYTKVVNYLNWINRTMQKN